MDCEYKHLWLSEQQSLKALFDLTKLLKMDSFLHHLTAGVDICCFVTYCGQWCFVSQHVSYIVLPNAYL